MKKQLLLIDGSSYIYRAFHAIPHLSNSKGLPTNAIYGFAQMLLKVIKDFKADHIAVAFDVKGPSFRHKMYEEYKAHRPEMPDSLKPQIPYIKELVRTLNIPVLEREGYEADDIIGTISKHMKEKDIEVIIIAADKDMMQLVDENTVIVDTMKDKKIGEHEVMERFGTKPDRIVEIMALAGDSSDNIPGVKGIGEKTAVKLIQQFGTIENLLLNLDKVKEKGIREKLKGHTEDARLSRKLAMIDTNVPVDYRFEDLAATLPDYPKLKELLKELEFTKLLKEIIPEEPSNIQSEYDCITDKEKLKSRMADIREAKEVAIVVKSVRGQASSVFAFCLKPNQAFSISTSCHRPQTLDFSLKPGALSLESVLEGIRSVIEDEGIKKMSCGIKTIHTFFKQYNIQMKGTNFDSGIASYLLNPSRASHALVDITGEYLENIEISKRQNAKVSEGTLDIDAACSVACAEADAVFQIAGKLLPLMESHGLLRLFHEIEMPLAEVLAEMERSGIKVDRDYLSNLSNELKFQIEILQSKIYTIACMDFNINSPKQLSSVLFEKLKLKPVRKTKTGFSTDEDVLKTLAAQHELPSEVLNFRQLSKLKYTYVDAMLRLINPATGRVHTSFNQTVTATGRLSSSEPNLQNIPIKTEFGKRIRQAFIADKDCLFLSADYSQIELRIVAHLSQDALLTEAFKNDDDIHTRTASEVFGIMPELVTPEMRRRAKAINFGIIYGMGPYGLSAELGISQDEAAGYIDNYFLHYKGVKAFIDKTINEAVENGYVTTLFGRRRYIPEMKSESEQIRRFGDRIAINTPVQGTAADMIKVAMINIFRRLRDGNFNTKMLLQIHDELLFEVPAKEMELIRELIIKEMEEAGSLSVPVKVDIQIGSSWGELGEYT
ncbi:MAG: DNA polymerase I [Deltaproteobacteria bacterium]|nr:DNA polymerase I [Deltaproteobacteria bacterium]